MPDRPNLLLITTDQQRFDTIHAAGNPSIFTPHLNWLCDTGIRFSRGYSDCPVCAPARATIMTGRHGWSHGQVGNDGKPSPMSRMPTLPGLLTAAGYQTHLHGKAHFQPTRAHYGFEHMEILPDYYRSMAARGDLPQPKAHGVGENEVEPVLGTADDQHSVTHWTVRRSIDFLETRDTSRPFFLWTSFSKPHPPFDPPEEYWRIYDGIPMPDPVRGDWSESVERMDQGWLSPSYLLANAQRFSPEQLRNVRRAYYACITQIDYKLGLLFARMREMGLLENTWIVFTSDHGEMLGDHHLSAKTVFFEPSAHVPLIVRPPGGWTPHPLAGRVDDRLACLADLMPTFLGLAGVVPPAESPLDGLDLLSDRRRDRLIGQCGGFHCLIEDSTKYHFCEDGGGELMFDLSADPMERRNLAQSPAHRPQRQTCRQALARHLADRGHPAAKDGELISLRPARLGDQVRRTAWPGFHSTGDADCDLLH